MSALTSGLWKKALSALGIQTGGEFRWGFKLRRRFYFIAAFLALVCSVGGMAVYSTSPTFCRSCHIMEPYYLAWSTSKHSDVACVDCHYPPGEPQTILWKKFQALSQVVKLITRTYSSKPYAEVEDASCLRSGCHSTRLLLGLVVSPKGILFNHKPHLEGVRYGRRLRCVSCHSQIVIGKHIEVTYRTCYQCHLNGKKEGRNIEPLGGCLGCHSVPDKIVKIGNISYNHKDFLGEHKVACQNCHQDVVQGAGDVVQERCLTCHNQPEKLSRYSEIEFIHDNHVTKHNTACLHCHNEIKHGASAPGKKTLTYECNVCHTDTHDLKRNVYMGVGARGVPPMPSPMYLSNVDCVGCHIAEKAEKNGASHSKMYIGSEKGCTNCHGKEYAGILDDVHAVMRETTAKVDGKLAALKSAALDASKKEFLTQEMTAALDDAAYNLSFLKDAHPIHNIYYAAQILRATDSKLAPISKKLEVEVENTADLPVISGKFCATLCHAKVGKKVPADIVFYKGLKVPHAKHLEEGLNCSVCHEFGAHKDVRMKTPTKCKKCHDDKDYDER